MKKKILLVLSVIILLPIVSYFTYNMLIRINTESVVKKNVRYNEDTALAFKDCYKNLRDRNFCTFVKNSLGAFIYQVKLTTDDNSVIVEINNDKVLIENTSGKNTLSRVYADEYYYSKSSYDNIWYKKLSDKTLPDPVTAFRIDKIIGSLYNKYEIRYVKDQKCDDLICYEYTISDSISNIKQSVLIDKEYLLIRSRTLTYNSDDKPKTFIYSYEQKDIKEPLEYKELKTGESIPVYDGENKK